MYKKRTVSFLLAAVLLFALAATGTVAFADGPVVATDVDLQVGLIVSQLSKMKQADGVSTWYYTITDLDHDGNLEFVAASQHPYDRSTNLKVWEVNADRSSLAECTLQKEEDESFPDILTDSVDTFYDQATNTWSYLFYDNVVISDYEVYTVETAVSMKDGVISYTPYAVEHTTVLSDYTRNVSHTDVNGFAISADQYNAAAFNAFAGTTRSSTSFDWLKGSDLDNLTKLTDSIAIFSGDKAPTETLRFPAPAALQETVAPATPAPTATPVPAATPVPQQSAPAYLSITKNPTNENKKSGGTAYFVACANIYDSLYWTFVSPNGGEYTPANFISGSNSTYSGEYSTTLTVSNVEDWMNGWGAYCTFYYQGQTARTSTAYIYVDTSRAQTPDWTTTYSSMSGTSYSNTIYDVYIVLQNGQGVTVDGSKVQMVSGYSIDGAPCTVYYTGSTPTASSIYKVDIYGISQSQWESTVNDVYMDDDIYIESYNNGTSYWENAYGESGFVDPDGSYININTDGSIEYWDATTGEYGYYDSDYGFIDYDW